jgi:hypothetical protein
VRAFFYLGRIYAGIEAVTVLPVPAMPTSLDSAVSPKTLALPAMWQPVVGPAASRRFTPARIGNFDAQGVSMKRIWRYFRTWDWRTSLPAFLWGRW